MNEWIVLSNYKLMVLYVLYCVAFLRSTWYTAECPKSDVK
jgi:hypothetical protein